MKGKKEPLAKCTITYYKDGTMDANWHESVVGLSVRMIQKSWTVMFQEYRRKAKAYVVTEKRKAREAAAENEEVAKESEKVTVQEPAGKKSEGPKQSEVING